MQPRTLPPPSRDERTVRERAHSANTEETLPTVSACPRALAHDRHDAGRARTDQLHYLPEGPDVGSVRERAALVLFLAAIGLVMSRRSTACSRCLRQRRLWHGDGMGGRSPAEEIRSAKDATRWTSMSFTSTGEHFMRRVRRDPGAWHAKGGVAEILAR